ncbi:glycine/D-amino acid oxidase-like deaminating enzyme [Rhizobium sp. SG_E_25_P2]|uniref:NAD(P)/FAD-dependent oxidoreductase n=1 Tax=Rhizobium sp. SG_E_25_P2 TaxID=2879942 RepID=UPI002476D0AA|nr:FAD-binding oxidoreductase [Rhizobium sp. SG_E_25_P2]MDH6264670.1 glycine/D-amino acid oxidase-like deaminating enzyme [Rhizobium sp. SG_E_25_P2]
MMLTNDPVWSYEAQRRETPQATASSGSVDLLVIGGGFCGLTGALHAARQGLGVRLVDAGRIGEGASGLNGGQVIPGLKYDPDWLLQHFGDKRGAAVVDFVSRTADAVFDLIEREKLDVPRSRSGWIQACHTEKALAAATARYKQWRGYSDQVEMLDATGIQSAIGADNYLGGFHDRRAGVINPLALTLELARLARENGVEIQENSRCTSLARRDNVWIARLADGSEIRAGKVLLAANAYSDTLIPGLAATLVPLHSLQIATAPIAEDVLRSILPAGQAVSDSRRILVYYRRAAGNRLILGGRGPMRLPRGPEDWAHLERALVRLFPSLRGVAIERRWFGRVAVTLDHLPHVHEPAPGLVTMVGCQGRGVGLMTASGPRLVDYLLSGDPDRLPLPLTPIAPIPFHRFRQVGVGAAIAWYRMLDALER